MSEKETQNSIPKNFNLWVRKSIGLLGSLGKIMENESASELLIGHGIPEDEVIEIVLFVPIAFCRKLLPQVKWHQEYIEFENNNSIEKLYSKNPRYLIIDNEVNLYWRNQPKKEVILNVAGRSAEFKAINELLLKGGRLEDIQVTKVVVSR
jgi:hypothetical protein